MRFDEPQQEKTKVSGADDSDRLLAVRSHKRGESYM